MPGTGAADLTARGIIDANLYLVLATADVTGRPWSSPVYFAHSGYAELFRRGQLVGPQYDRRGDILTQCGVGDSKGHRLCHRWMLQQNVVHFLRGYLLPTAIDDLAYAPSKKQVPVIIKQTNIPRLEPIARKCSPGRPFVTVVT